MTNKTRRNKQKKAKTKAKTVTTMEGATPTSTIDMEIAEHMHQIPDDVTPPTVNREDKQGFIAAGLKTLSSIMERWNLANLGGLQYEGARDLYTVFGYKKKVTAQDFYAKYIRQDITSRIIDAPPGATWADPPKFGDNEAIQTAWDEMMKTVQIWNVMQRADRLARLGHFSSILYGFDDAGSLATPVNPSKVNQLLYARPLSERMITEITFNSNIRDARFGLPETYTVQFDDPNGKKVTLGNLTTQGVGELKVHHSRMIHIVENPLEDTIFGIPIIERIFNLLDDLLKVAGGTSEMYWLSARQGLHANIDKDMDLDPEDQAALSDEFDEYQHQLRRTLRTRGVDVKDLGSTPPSPKDTFEMLIALISGTTGIPRRILLGSEVGQLASEQDRANWSERIDDRIKLFAQPFILEPTVRLFQTVGLLPEGVVEYEWPSAFRESPKEKAETMAQKARAIGNISRQTGNQQPMQLTSRTEAREIVGLKGDLPESEILMDMQEEIDKAVQAEKDKQPAVAVPPVPGKPALTPVPAKAPGATPK